MNKKSSLFFEGLLNQVEVFFELVSARGQTSIVVPYSLSYVPNLSDIIVSARTNIGTANLWVSDETVSSFTINLCPANTTDQIITWYINNAILPSTSQPAPHSASLQPNATMFVCFMLEKTGPTTENADFQLQLLSLTSS
jgi:hypothetical protein